MPAWLRPSNFGRLAACPASGVTGEGMPSASGEAATLGTAVHALAEQWVSQGREIALAMAPEIAREHGVDVDEVARIASALPEEVPPGAMSEVDVVADLGEGIEIKGRADLAFDLEDAAAVWDLKTGNPEFAEASGLLQLEVYGVGVAQDQGHDRAVVRRWYIRAGEDGWEAPLLVELDEAIPRLRRIAQAALAQAEKAPADRDYRTGSQCAFCPGKPVCPALRAELAPILQPADGDWLPAVTRENAAHAYELAGLVERRVKAVKDAVKDLVAREGPVPIGGGKELALVEVSKGEYVVKASSYMQLTRRKVQQP